jgi:hypothetical protein
MAKAKRTTSTPRRANVARRIPAQLQPLGILTDAERAAQPVATWSTTWAALDDVDTKLSDLAHTAEVLDSIDTASPKALGLIVHMWRHLMSDLALLQEANAAARAAILDPAKAKKGSAQ